MVHHRAGLDTCEIRSCRHGSRHARHGPLKPPLIWHALAALGGVCGIMGCDFIGQPVNGSYCAFHSGPTERNYVAAWITFGASSKQKQRPGLRTRLPAMRVLTQQPEPSRRLANARNRPKHELRARRPARRPMLARGPALAWGGVVISDRAQIEHGKPERAAGAASLRAYCKCKHVGNGLDFWPLALSSGGVASVPLINKLSIYCSGFDFSIRPRTDAFSVNHLWDARVWNHLLWQPCSVNKPCTRGQLYAVRSSLIHGESRNCLGASPRVLDAQGHSTSQRTLEEVQRKGPGTLETFSGALVFLET